MSNETLETPDPAAIFACALSLWQACQKLAASDKDLNFSESYHGFDEFMRQVMRVATAFETWACSHVEFTHLEQTWPYLLEGEFGDACLDILLPTALAEFDSDDCLRVALQLRLPVALSAGLPVPIDVSALNPLAESAFKKFRIQTVRELLEDGDVVPYVAGDEPFDDDFGGIHFGIYGVSQDGMLEHIADRESYEEARGLAQKLAPGIDFPVMPIFSGLK